MIDWDGDNCPACQHNDAPIRAADSCRVWLEDRDLRASGLSMEMPALLYEMETGRGPWPEPWPFVSFNDGKREVG